MTIPNGPSVLHVITLPNLTRLYHIRGELYQTLPTLTVRYVGPTAWHIVPDLCTLEPFARWTMAI